MSSDDLYGAIERVLSRIDMYIDGESIDCLIPMESAIYEDEGFERNVFVKALIEELQGLGLRLDGIAVVSIHRCPPIRRRRMSARRARVIDRRVQRGQSLIGKRGIQR